MSVDKKPLSVLNINVVNCEERMSSKGTPYYLVTYYADLGNMYPDLVTDFNFKPVSKGESKLVLHLESDRNKNLSLVKKFSAQID